MERKKIGIIGGGASGMLAAISASRTGAFVTILERNDRIGKKILVTGNGKCNLTNLNLSKDDYRSDHPYFVAEVLDQFSVLQTLTFFEELGLLWKEKSGSIYPISNQASTVLDLLRFELEKQKIQTITECNVKSITYQKNKACFEVKTADQTYLFDRIIVATGSNAGSRQKHADFGYQIAKQFGHKMKSVIPALVQLKSNLQCFKSLAGIRVDATLELYIKNQPFCTESGELQITDYGISGIPVFQFSRFAADALLNKQKVEVKIDLIPQINQQELLELLIGQCKKNKAYTLEQILTGCLHKKLIPFVIKESGLKSNTACDRVSQQNLVTLVRAMKEWSVPIYSANTMDMAQVSAGGICVEDITKNMESKLQKGLFFVGEMLDVDGRCGGYNLQWAWTSGYLAGIEAGK